MIVSTVSTHSQMKIPMIRLRRRNIDSREKSLEDATFGPSEDVK
jgi:hypothetical protein